MDLHATGQNDASWLYPAVTDQELADQDELVTNYRRSMGRSRVLVGVIVFGAIAYVADWISRGSKRAA